MQINVYYSAGLYFRVVFAYGDLTRVKEPRSGWVCDIHRDEPTLKPEPRATSEATARTA